MPDSAENRACPQDGSEFDFFRKQHLRLSPLHAGTSIKSRHHISHHQRRGNASSGGKAINQKYAASEADESIPPGSQGHAAEIKKSGWPDHLVEQNDGKTNPTPTDGHRQNRLSRLHLLILTRNRVSSTQKPPPLLISEAGVVFILSALQVKTSAHRRSRQ